MNKVLLIFLVVILITLGIFFYAKNASSPDEGLLKEIKLDRQEIMKDVAQRIGKISPVEPVVGGGWYVGRFWFISDDNENFYVEYEDGHILRRVLLGAEKKGDELKYKVAAYFEPGENTWVLKRGEDKFFSRSLDLYEHDEEFGFWVKKN